MSNKAIKYPFPTAAIFLFVSSLFYFISLVLCDELPYIADTLSVSCLFRFIGVIMLGVFLLVKRVPVGTLISIGVLIFAQIIDWFVFSDISAYYLSYEYDPFIFMQNLLILCAFIFAFLLALTNIMNNGFVKLTKAWFVGIILSALAFFMDLLVYANISELVPMEIDDVMIGNFLGNIFICVAFCLMPRWFRDVAKAKEENLSEVTEPVLPSYYEIPAMPVYDPFLYSEKSEPVAQEDNEADALRKYKALYDEGVITQEEFELKKKQILNI